MQFKILPFLLITLTSLSLLSTETQNKNATSENLCEDKEKKENKKEDKEEPPKIGNFSLRQSQQPAALFGFGGNVIDKGQVQFYCFADEFIGNKQILTDVIPNILFGVTDSFSIQFNLPFTPIMKIDNSRSSGLEDFFIQLEYAFYNKSTYTYQDQATLVLNATAPTGSIKKNPNTGFGAPTYFFGGTYYRTYVHWFFFTSQGAILTQSRNGTRLGNQILYQWGLGRNFPSPYGWIYAWMLEIDGQYYGKNQFNHIRDPLSGGNVVYFTPSLWVSNNQLLFQFGVSLPVYQSFPSNLGKYNYGLNLNFAWSFN